MSQVIAVRFINPADGQQVFGPDRMTKAGTHREAVELALAAVSGRSGRLISMDLIRPETWSPAGANSHWQSKYACLLYDEEYPRAVDAILFAQYRENVPEA